MNCFQPAAGPTCFVMLGKFGDLIHMLPVFLHTYNRDKVKPVVMVSEQFASVLDGVSYVTPWVVPMKWPDELNAAKIEAEKHFGCVVVPQYWNIPVPQSVVEGTSENCTLAMWKASGIDQQHFGPSPVVFDRRDAAREEFLCMTAGANGRPVILYNLEGSSCPFPFAAEVLTTLRLLKGTCTLINLAEIRAERIYDLLGLYDRAAGLITVDTATLHLAGTGIIPYVALLNNGWSRAEPKGKCWLKMAYDEVPERMTEIAQQVMKMAVVKRKPITRNMEDPPSIVKQTHWPVRILNELPKDAEYFNPSLVDRPDGRWLIARKSKHMNSIMAFRLQGDRVVGQGVAVPIAARQDGEHFEDPRAFWHLGRIWLSCCNFMWGPVYTGAHQVLCEIGMDWRMIRRYDVVYGGNGNHVGGNHRWEKNWLWFFHDGVPHMIYTTLPHVVVQFDEKFNARQQYSTMPKRISWPWGEPRGGTPPVRIGDEYWTFFHSSSDWKQMVSRRYHMGCYTFSAKPPFAMKRYTQMPILSGSQYDRFAHPKPLVVFPCGAILKNGVWQISLGVNDLDCALMEIPHSELEKLLTTL
jgi:beta-1,4-mannooligosaccharide phosphorylase